MKWLALAAIAAGVFGYFVIDCKKDSSGDGFSADELEGLKNPAMQMPEQAGQWMKYQGPPPGKPGSKWKSEEEYQASLKKAKEPG